MAHVSTYLNFTNQTEAAFTFYKSVFGGEFIGFQRFSDVPNESSKLSEADKNLIMHVSLKIMGDYELMGTDAPEAMGFNKLVMGNNVYLTLHPDSKEEADRLFGELSAGGVVEMPMQDAFWGDYYGSFRDKFGIGWMINYSKKE